MNSLAPRRLLAISWELPPLAGPRAIQVSRTLEGLTWHGWHSTTITLAPRVGGTALRDGGSAPAVDVPGVTVSRVASPEEGLAWRALCRMVPWLAHWPDRSRPWIRPAAARAQSHLAREQHDVIVSFAQPWSGHLVGLRVASLARLPWVAHFSDPWVDSPYAAAVPRWLERKRRDMERRVIASAAAVVFVTSETADLVMGKYPAAWQSKVQVVPHAFDQRVAVAAAGERRRRLRLVYTGRFYRAQRTPVAVFDALARLQARGDLRDLELLLVGPDASDYRAEAVARGIAGSVEFMSRVPYAESLRIAASADVLLVIDAPSISPSPFLPSKLIEYLPLRRPILGLTDPHGASATLLRELQCPVAPAADVDAIAAAVSALLQRWRTDGLRLSPQFDAVIERYEMRQTTAQFARILETHCRVPA